MIAGLYEGVLNRLGWTIFDLEGNERGNTAGRPPVELPLIHMLALVGEQPSLQLVMDTGAAKYKMVKRNSACGLKAFLVTGADINEVVGGVTPLELVVSAHMTWRDSWPGGPAPVFYARKAAAAFFQAGAKPGFFHPTRLQDESHCVLTAAVAADNVDVAIELTTIPGLFRGAYPFRKLVRQYMNS